MSRSSLTRSARVRPSHVAWHVSAWLKVHLSLTPTGLLDLTCVVLVVRGFAGLASPSSACLTFLFSPRSHNWSPRWPTTCVKTLRLLTHTSSHVMHIGPRRRISCSTRPHILLIERPHDLEGDQELLLLPLFCIVIGVEEYQGDGGKQLEFPEFTSSASLEFHR